MKPRIFYQLFLMFSFLAFPLSVREAAAAQGPVAIVQSAITGGPSAPLTLTLPAAPAATHTIYAILGFGIYGDRSMTPPDITWTCSIGGGSSVTTGATRINICSHVVVAGDSKSYTFTPTSTDGPGINGVILEVSNTVSAQIAYSYAGDTLGLLSSVPSPALTPSVLGTLPIAVASGGGVPTAGSAGWQTLQNGGGIAVTVGGLTTNTTTPVSTSFNYYYNNAANSLQALVLFVPGTFASAPTANPVAGNYSTTQEVALSDSLPGAVIHYTLDGTVPTCSSTTYSSPIAISTTTTLSYLACATGYANSAIVSGTYVVAGGTLQGISLGAMGDFHGYVPFAGDLFHQDISTAAVDANSDNIIANIGATHLHHDWSSVNGGNYGIPYTVVDSTVVPLVSFVNQQYSDESDVTLYPIPTYLTIESTPPTCTVTGDNHAIIIDKHSGVDYEFYRAQYCPTSTPIWQAVNGVLWDMTINEKRPYDYTSVDAAGLSVFEGLVRYDEIVAGAINHAIRFTTAVTRCDHYDDGDGVGSFVPPATHAACLNSGTLNITGMRIRLKASFDISGYSPTNQIILTAMKKYGLILADNGSTLYYQGTPDARWNDNDLQALDTIASSNLEVLEIPTIETNDSHPTGAAPGITYFGASSATISQGQSVTLSMAVNGASYSYVDNAGFMRGNSITTSPTQTTTYTLISRNAYGSTSSTPVTVTVTPAQSLTVDLPAFSPAGGTYAGSQTITMSDSSTSPVSIYYTLNGSTPTSSSLLYSAPLQISSTCVIKAIAVAGGTSSSVATAPYTILPDAVRPTPAPPTVSRPPTTTPSPPVVTRPPPVIVAPTIFH